MNKKGQLESLFQICRQASTNQTCITDDSREVKKGDIFVAVKGIQNDGHHFIKAAIQKGASTLVVEDESFIPSSFHSPYFVVPHTQSILPLLLGHYYNFPSEKMFCVGVTGTNGKTTTASIIEFLFKTCGWKTGLIGTVSYRWLNEERPSLLTTPKATDLHSMLSQFYKRGVQGLAMEVSSIGLDQHRVDHVDFNVAIFTNLARDHLDYHKNIDDYYKSKKRFFEILKTSKKNHCVAILNSDDEYSSACQNTCGLTFLTYGAKGKDLKYEITKETLSGTEFIISYKQVSKKVFFPMVGAHNVSNASAALLAGLVAGFSLESLCENLGSFPGVKGRLQKVPIASPFSVFIDYAHTPDALDRTLGALKGLKKEGQKLIVVFGCGGDRDEGKREVMGRVVATHSDRAVVTSDNPRNTDPQVIIKDILKGIPSDFKYDIQEDRKKAIQRAFSLAQKGDVVLIAGKGHESVQIVKEKRISFNDYEVAMDLLKTGEYKDEMELR